MKANRGTVWINAGLLLIAAALFLSAYNAWESHEARDSARQVIAQLCDALPTETGDDEAEPTTLPESLPDVQREMPVKTINGRDYIGVLSIPSLELELPVISQWDYPALKVAPCRYSGSLYQDNLIICAHNYASHFGKLKELQPGDTVLFTDMDEHVVTFQVVERETLNPMDTEGMEDYLDCFKYGMPPHGGLGIGLERLTMKLVGEDNVRETTLFPRDLSRLEP